MDGLPVEDKTQKIKRGQMINREGGRKRGRKGERGGGSVALRQNRHITSA